MKPAAWTPSTPAITAAELPAMVSCQPVVVVHCWAVWNGHDRRMDARLKWERIKSWGRIKSWDRIAFLSFDTDLLTAENPELLPELRVLNIPALVCFVHGRHHATAIGMRSGRDLREMLREWARAGALPPQD